MHSSGMDGCVGWAASAKAFKEGEKESSATS